MNKKYNHNIFFSMELPPFFILNSILMHIIVLSFLLTLPIYSAGKGTKSLQAYFTYLAGEEETKTKSLSGHKNSPKQITVSRNNEDKTNLPESIIRKDITSEEIASAVKTPDDVPSEEVNTEKNSEDVPELKEKESEVSEKPLDIKTSSFSESAKNDNTSEKEVEKAERTDITGQISPAQLPEVRERTNINLLSVDLPAYSQNNVSENVMKLPAADSQLTEQTSIAIVEKGKAADKREYKTEKSERPMENLPVQAETKSLPVQTPEKNIEKPAPQKSAAVRRPSPDLKTKQAVPVKKEEKMHETPNLPKAMDDTNSTKKTPHMDKPVQEPKVAGEETKDLSEQSSSKPLFSAIEQKMKNYFFDLLPTDEKTSVSDSETLLSGLSGGTDLNPGPVTADGNVETDMSAGKGPVKDVKAEPELKEKAEKNTETEGERPSLGLPLNKALFYKDIQIEILQEDAASTALDVYLLKNNYLSLRKRHGWGKEKKVELVAETVKGRDTIKEVKKVFSVAKSDSGVYTLAIENRNAGTYSIEVLITFYEGKPHERRKEIKSVSVPPLSIVRFMFVLPDAIFWDDENYFTGSMEDSDSITKFNDKTGFLWREEKDQESR